VIVTEGAGVADESGVADGGWLADVSLGSGVALAGGWLPGGWLAGGAEAGGAEAGGVDGLVAGVPDGVGDPEAATVADAAGVEVGAWDAGALGSGWRVTTATEPGSDGAERLTTIRRVPSLEPKTVCGSVANVTG
jgi:hypothetical protein